MAQIQIPLIEMGEDLYTLVDRRYNSKPLVKLLLKAGTDPNKKDKYGRTPLMGATVCGLRNTVVALLEAPDIDRDATDVFGRTALMEATTRRHRRIAKLLSRDHRDDPEWGSFHPGDDFGPRGNVICAVCRASTFLECANRCSICNFAQFDICEECQRFGAICLDDTHQLVKQEKS